MTIRELFLLCKLNVKLVVAAALSCGIAAVVVTNLLMPNLFSASANVYVTTAATRSEGGGSARSPFFDAATSSVADLLASEPVKHRAANALGLDNLNAFDIIVSQNGGSSIIRISVDGATSDDLAADVIGAIIEETSSELDGAVDSGITIETGDITSSDIPTGPNRNLYIAFGLFAGTVLSVSYLMVRDLGDLCVRNVALIEWICGARALAKLEPVSRKPNISLVDLSAQSNSIPANVQTSFDTLAANVRFVSARQVVRSLVVTSTTSGEGKTTVAWNLGRSLSMGGSAVLIMDCDAKRKGLSAQLRRPSEYGLCDVLDGNVPLESCIQSTAFAHLSVFPFGKCVGSSSALFASQRFQQVLAAVQNVFRYVIIDASSIQSAADAAVLASIADATIVVVGWDQVTPGELQAAVQQLGDAEASVIGTFINRYDAQLERNVGMPTVGVTFAPFSPSGRAAASTASSAPSDPWRG